MYIYLQITKPKIIVYLQVRGNITVTLWHYLLVRFCKTLHSSMQRKFIWDGGFLASVGQSQINILMRFNGEDTIDMIIKGQLTSTSSHDRMWHFIGIFNDEIGKCIFSCPLSVFLFTKHNFHLRFCCLFQVLITIFFFGYHCFVFWWLQLHILANYSFKA